jgi:hypothetical protein
VRGEAEGLFVRRTQTCDVVVSHFDSEFSAPPVKPSLTKRVPCG